MNTRRAAPVGPALVMAVLVGCGGGTGSSGSPTGNGPPTPSASAAPHSVTITEGDGFSFGVAPGTPTGVSQYSGGLTAGTVVANPGMVYVALPLTVTNDQSDRSASLNDLFGDDLSNDLTFLGFPSGSAEASSGNCASQAPGAPTLPAGCLVAAMDVMLPGNSPVFGNATNPVDIPAGQTEQMTAYFGPVPNNVPLSGLMLCFALSSTYQVIPIS